MLYLLVFLKVILCFLQSVGEGFECCGCFCEFFNVNAYKIGGHKHFIFVFNFLLFSIFYCVASLILNYIYFLLLCGVPVLKHSILAAVWYPWCLSTHTYFLLQCDVPALNTYLFLLCGVYGV